MSVQQLIQRKVQDDLSPVLLRVENESHRHSGPASESHFKLTVVAEAFAGLPRVQRHRHVYGLLQQQLQSGVHALALHLYSPEEWEAGLGAAPGSPACRGGSA